MTSCSNSGRSHPVRQPGFAGFVEPGIDRRLGSGIGLLPKRSPLAPRAARDQPRPAAAFPAGGSRSRAHSGAEQKDRALLAPAAAQPQREQLKRPARHPVDERQDHAHLRK